VVAHPDIKMVNKTGDTKLVIFILCIMAP